MAKKTKSINVKIKNTSGRIICVMPVKIKVGEYYTEKRLLGLAVEKAVIKGVSMREANLFQVDMHGLNIQDGDFTNSNLDEAIFRKANVNNCNFQYASMNLVDFSNGDISNSNFYEVYIHTPDLLNTKFTHVIGDGKYLKTIMALDWHIVYTKTHMAIGCRQYKLSEWWKFTAKEIKPMHGNANRFWKRYKPLLQEIIKRNKAG